LGGICSREIYFTLCGEDIEKGQEAELFLYREKVTQTELQRSHWKKKRGKDHKRLGESLRLIIGALR